MQTIAQKLESVDARLRRWETRLKRAATMVDKLSKQRRRLNGQLVVAEMTAPPGEKTVRQKAAIAEALSTDYDAVEAAAAALVEKKPDEGIPKFLDRSDPLIAEKMTAARKKAEAEERKKMPLAGREAIAYLKSKPRKRDKSVEA